MEIRGFEWDENNIGHLIARHPVEPEEVEEIFTSQAPPLVKQERAGRYRALGITEHDRYIVVIFENKGAGIIRPITAREMKQSEKREYKEYRQRRRHRP